MGEQTESRFKKGLDNEFIADLERALETVSYLCSKLKNRTYANN